MAYRQIRARQEQPATSKQSDRKSRALAAFGRVSTTFQALNNESETVDQQIQDRISAAIKEGWQEEFIVEIKEGDGKRGVSGSKDIGKRVGYQELMGLITSRAIGTISVRDVSRLFRVKSRVPIEQFIDACRDNDVIVKTRDMTYDFNLPGFDELFRMQAKFASDYISNQIRTMHDANFRRAKLGHYHGQPLFPGFIVDRNKKLPDGKDNPNHMRLVEYEPHAKIVREIFARFKALGAQFNLLCHEYATGSIVFPPFESWVGPRDVSKLMLGKVTDAEGNILGYSMTPLSLAHTLTAVEYAGYDKFNEKLDDESYFTHIIPESHTAIVPLNDWQFAFDALSFTTLDGTPNLKRRNTGTWVANQYTTKDGKQKGGQKALLQGILTSPLGNVQYTSGMYRVVEFEKKPGKVTKSNTLTVDADMLHSAIMYATLERLAQSEEVRQQAINDLKTAREQNTQAVVKNEKMIRQFKQEIASIQAFIKAVGASAEPGTLVQYNNDLLRLRADIAQLEEQNRNASTEVEGINDLWDLLFLMPKEILKSGEGARRFLRLSTSQISIDEYSSHYLRLVIVWKGPLSQTDIAFIRRDDGSHFQWSEEDETDLRRLYPDADRLELFKRFPNRTWSCIATWANRLEIARNTRLNTSGITDRFTSLLDRELENKQETYVNRGVRWFYDVSTDNDLLLNSCPRATQVVLDQQTVTEWLTELKELVA